MGSLGVEVIAIMEHGDHPAEWVFLERSGGGRWEATTRSSGIMRHAILLAADGNFGRVSFKDCYLAKGDTLTLTVNISL